MVGNQRSRALASNSSRSAIDPRFTKAADEAAYTSIKFAGINPSKIINQSTLNFQGIILDVLRHLWDNLSIATQIELIIPDDRASLVSVSKVTIAQTLTSQLIEEERRGGMEEKEKNEIRGPKANLRSILIKMEYDLAYCYIFNRRSYYVSNYFMKLIKWTPLINIFVESPIIPI
ncbi:hypothetical protein IEQ34_012371 [Dendrobium chrysotoxum]|uniref:Uncharacterized protein n=1 Tax=Dendrobium chrysotoxum TaxID=161865 RepID=A0AAV7GVG4_DENCH|nr:hypothetical protein IEQ34_012371 [Dendrobium chrysotoxum]